ncbi:MAG: penicillin-binding protein, partial [Deltaproteobacteria bacterium]|nr:penicillin-binding protein [Deltaproteobacteria bacterium]
PIPPQRVQHPERPPEVVPAPHPVVLPGPEAEEALAALDAPDMVVPDREKAPPIATLRGLAPDQDLLARARGDGRGRWVVDHGGATRTLTVDPQLQGALEKMLRDNRTPFAAVVALDPATGRVLAMAEHAQGQPAMRGLAVKAAYPAASIFKIVTASALVERGFGPDSEECTHGGKRGVTLNHLKDSRRDRQCMTLGEALARSTNGVFAKLTFKNLSAAGLKQVAERFHFNRALDFPVPTDTSLAAFPAEPLELARTGAGFGDVYLSPLHGAALAAVVANRGSWRTPVLFDDVAPPPAERVISEAAAEALASMMEQTVTSGTARKTFRERGHGVPGAVGKTGSLADRQPFRDYSWFVGYAPRDNPRVAVAAVVVNGELWHVRAPTVAREAMRLALQVRGPTQVASAK